MPKAYKTIYSSLANTKTTAIKAKEPLIWGLVLVRLDLKELLWDKSLSARVT
jgi:hypothetical protein